MKKVLVLVLPLLHFSGNSSVDINRLYRDGDTAVRQLHGLFEMRTAVVRKTFTAKAEPKTVSISPLEALSIDATRCKPLDFDFRNYFAAFDLVRPESSIQAKLMLISLQNDIMKSYSEYCKAVDPCIELSCWH